MARMHLLAPVTEPEALSAYRSGLSAAHAALTARLVTTAGKVTPPPLGAAHWVVQIKRSPVDVGGVPMVPEGVESQPFSEVVNQLATVERLIDALDWAVGQQMDTVEQWQREGHQRSHRPPGLHLQGRRKQTGATVLGCVAVFGGLDKEKSPSPTVPGRRAVTGNIDRHGVDIRAGQAGEVDQSELREKPELPSPLSGPGWR